MLLSVADKDIRKLFILEFSYCITPLDPIILKISLFFKYYLLFYQYLSIILSSYQSIYLLLYLFIDLSIYPNHLSISLSHLSINLSFDTLSPQTHEPVSCCSSSCLLPKLLFLLDLLLSYQFPQLCYPYFSHFSTLFISIFLTLSHICPSLAGWKKREGGRRVRDREIKG